MRLFAELDPPFRPVNGTERPSFRGSGRGAMKGLSFGWDAETLPGNALTGRVRDRERRRSADDDVCTRDQRRWGSIATTSAWIDGPKRFLRFEPH